MNPSSRAVVRRLPPAGAAIMAALLLAGASAISTAFAQATGGFIEKADSLAARPRWTPAQIRSFLPRRGGFTFPAPYQTGGVRLTSPSDCGGGDCVLPLSGSSGRNINNHRGRDTMLIFLGLRGSGPTLFGYDKRTDQVRNLGPLFDAASPFASRSGEGWYFSATQPTRLYVSDGGPALLRYDVETRAFETVFDATGQFGEGIGIDQAHSSDDDTVHSALLRDSTSHRVLGCLAYREKVQGFSYYPATADGDECEVDKSGRWLLIRQRAAQADAEDDRIVDLETGAEKTLIGETAAGGPSDTGHGYLLAKDASSSLAAAVRIWDFDKSPPPGRVMYQASSAAGDLRHIAHANAQSDVEPSRQFACGSTGTTPSGSRPGEIVCFRLDGSQDVLIVAQTMVDPSAPLGEGSNPKLSNGNLDVTGRYFLWVSNTGGRADAFMVKVPADVLMGAGSDAASPILPTTTSAAPVPSGSLNLAAVSITITDPDTVVTLSPEDTFINVDATNQSSNTRLMTYTWPDHEVANAILMKFDLSTIPAGAVVTDARLQLALVETDAKVESTYTVTAHKVMGRNPVIAAATGYTADGVAVWTPNACCAGDVPLAQADISPAYDTQAIDKTPGYKSWSLTAMAQEWVADPTNNFGVLLNSDASKLRDRYRFFASMEQVDTSLRPSLTIAYSLRADVTPPVISAVTASAITISGAAISWTTNEPSDSQVEYGTTTAYGSLTTFRKTRVTSHAATLGGLAASTLYHFRVRSRDFAGNLAVSSDFTLTTLGELIPPAVSITAPTTGTTVTGTVTIAANASDNVGVIGVQFKLGGANLGAEDTTSPYAVSWNTTTVAEGSYTLAAVARDAAGNATISAGVTVTVAGGVVTLAPEDTFIGLDANNQSANVTLMTYTWPDYRTANAILMKFDLSAIPPGAVVTDATLQLALVASDAAAENTYTVTAHKMVGRSPVITGATGYTADGVTAWTPNTCCSGNVPLAQADVSAAYDSRAIDQTLGYKSWSITAMVQEWMASPATNFGLMLDSDASKLRDRYRYFASMENADSGLRPSLRVTYSLDPDVTPPAVSITAPTTGATATGTVTVAASASDNVAVAGVQFQLDGVNLGVEGTTAPYSVAWNSAGAANGSHALTAVARDAAGNVTTSADVTVTVANDTTPPSVAITAPVGGASVSGTVAVTATASDNVGVVGVQFKLDGANLGAEDPSSPYSVPWSTTAAANGSHALSAVARDTAGNIKTSASVTVTVANGAPTGGIAALYPGDVGIESNSDVIFVERFDEATVANMQSRWTDVRNGPTMQFSSDVPAGSPGPHSLNIPWVGGGVSDGGHLYKQLSPGIDDTLHIRYYIKYPTSGTYNHTGIWMGGNNPPLSWPNPQAGIKPAGNDRFIAAAEQNTITTGFDHYDYWMNMHQSGDGNYWGNFLLNNPSIDARPGEWTCVEHMVKLNNPTTSFNGEHAIWLNGVKVSHLGLGFPNGRWSGGIFTPDPTGSPFEGFRWRSDASLNINWIWLQNYAPSELAGFTGTMLFDHVVAARSYIGCLASGTPDPTPPTVSITSPSALATVSGTITPTASASDNVGVVGVQFKLDGVNLGAEDTSSPYTVSWNTTTASAGLHTLTAVARDAAGNTATSTSIAVTVSNVTGSWPNEPAGFTSLNDQPWNGLTGNGWNYLRRTSSKDDRILADSTAPFSPLNDLQIIFTTDMVHDTEPSVHWMGLSSVKEIYTGWWMKVSPNWSCSPAGCGKVTFLFTNGAGQVYSNLYHPSSGVGPPYRVGANTEWAPYGQKIWYPNVTTTNIYPGEWHRIEYYYKWETTPGAADGIIRWWVDGTLNGNFVNVQYPSSAGFIEFQYAPTLQNPPPAEQYMYIDHTHVSKK